MAAGGAGNCPALTAAPIAAEICSGAFFSARSFASMSRRGPYIL